MLPAFTLEIQLALGSAFEETRCEVRDALPRHEQDRHRGEVVNGLLICAESTLGR